MAFTRYQLRVHVSVNLLAGVWPRAILRDSVVVVVVVVASCVRAHEQYR